MKHDRLDSRQRHNQVQTMQPTSKTSSSEASSSSGPAPRVNIMLPQSALVAFGIYVSFTFETHFSITSFIIGAFHTHVNSRMYGLNGICTFVVAGLHQLAGRT
jgi:hypothetical protein